VSASGAYTSSSNQDTDEATERCRPQGQKAAKEQQKGKDKAGKTWLSDENVAQFNDLQVEKSSNR
jgi:biotin-(acetyl-CoA carboxylase) ligase